MYFTIICSAILSIASCIQLSSASIKTATFLSCANWQIEFTLASYSFFSFLSLAEREVQSFIFWSKENLHSPVGLKTEKGMLSEIAAFSIEARVCAKALLKSLTDSFPSAEKSKIVPILDSHNLSIVTWLCSIVSPPQNCLYTVAFIIGFMGRCSFNANFDILVSNFEKKGLLIPLNRK